MVQLAGGWPCDWLIASSYELQSIKKPDLNVLVPHSQCSLRENPKILPNFRSKNNTLRETF
jgi:hypothetical protein